MAGPRPTNFVGRANPSILGISKANLEFYNALEMVGDWAVPVGHKTLGSGLSLFVPLPF